jgi:hypothetical protein
MVDHAPGSKRARCASTSESSLTRQHDHRAGCRGCACRELGHRRRCRFASTDSGQAKPWPPTAGALCPALERSPAVPARVVAVLHRGNDSRAHAPARLAVDCPQSQGRHHRYGAVHHPWQQPSRCRDNHRAAASAAIPAKLDPHLLRLPSRPHRPDHDPLARTVTHQRDGAASDRTGPTAGWAVRRPDRLDRRRPRCPKFDVALEVDDAYWAPLFDHDARSTTGTFSRRAPSPTLCGRLRVDAPPPGPPLLAEQARSGRESGEAHHHPGYPGPITLRAR